MKFSIAFCLVLCKTCIKIFLHSGICIIEIHQMRLGNLSRDKTRGCRPPSWARISAQAPTFRTGCLLQPYSLV